MKPLFTTFLFLFILSSARAEGLDVLSLLKRDLGKMIVVKSDKEIWYCPDNTCEMYKTIKYHADFPAFVYLYLFYKSGYIYIKESIGGYEAFRKMAVEEPKVKAKVSHYCPNKKKPPSCILKHMKQKLGIALGFGRYDEGYFCYGYNEKENICKKL